jgi:hypothetical protein
MDVDHLSELELAYECMCAAGYHVAFAIWNVRSNNVFYCESAIESKECIGCIGVQRKQYCILNKQYSFEEYEKLAPKVIEHMIKNKEWGKFFPKDLTPYGYNKSIAHDYYPLDKEGALSRGFKWSDYEQPAPKADKLIEAGKLPDNLNDVPDDVVNWGIVCEESGKPFKLTPQELKFYRKYNIPLPRRHPEVRYFDRMALRSQPKLHERTCSKCEKKIRSTYDAKRKEKIYCEECYLKTVY